MATGGRACSGRRSFRHWRGWLPLSDKVVRWYGCLMAAVTLLAAEHGIAGWSRMSETESRVGQGSGHYNLAAWNDAGLADLTATGDDPDTALAAGLTGVLAAASGGALANQHPEEAGSAAAIRGQGADFARLFSELAADLLAQVDANGIGLTHVRLDGVLGTDDGYTAWGYVLGTPRGQGAAVNVELAGDPAVEQTEGRTVLQCTLRRFES